MNKILNVYRTTLDQKERYRLIKQKIDADVEEENSYSFEEGAQEWDERNFKIQELNKILQLIDSEWYCRINDHGVNEISENI
jgi:hypothetical protein